MFIGGLVALLLGFALIAKKGRTSIKIEVEGPAEQVENVVREWKKP